MVYEFSHHHHSQEFTKPETFHYFSRISLFAYVELTTPVPYSDLAAV
jgi:hypothetical protein